ncbi:restriction endonuclease subunit S [Thermostichus vulcanus]|uniref:Restriction endonuclease subunit S n=1 Tax=Thermostichus vulcanus str. 'Rupite' TaxID=2813851 RepID=A0ABT0C8L1_THEVL|nr:restriction endonuclease subunit S [Thermostichus vulcanus]MCJ2542136.1 restriction endonuclease subunit S [Thermostichus vulcanus str. 'Rupite']
MSEWKELSFENAPLEIIDGDRGINYPKQSDFLASGYCLFLNAGNVTKTGFNFSDCTFISQDKDSILRKGKLNRGDIVLTTRGTVGNVAFFDSSVPFENIRINSGMVILRPKVNNLDPRYLYLFVRSLDFQEQVLALRSGSAQPQLPIRDINQIGSPDILVSIV